MAYHLKGSGVFPVNGQGSSFWRRSQLGAEHGEGVTDTLMFKEGLTLGYMCYQPAKDLIESSYIDREQRTLTLTIALEGQSTTQGVDGQCFDFVAGHSTITAFRQVRGERHFPAGQTIRQLRLTVEETLLEQYQLLDLLLGIKDDCTATRVFFGQSTPSIQHHTQQLLELYHRDGQPLALHIAALTLLSLQLTPLAKPVVSCSRIRGQDQDKLLRAREILHSQYAQTLTLAYLCAAVGTNALTLKKGFHQLFGTTPFQMLTDIRMAKATELLASGLRVSSVAYQVGYQHLSSFSAAFERYYGCAPSAYYPKSFP